MGMKTRALKWTYLYRSLEMESQIMVKMLPVQHRIRTRGTNKTIQMFSAISTLISSLPQVLVGWALLKFPYLTPVSSFPLLTNHHRPPSDWHTLATEFIKCSQ